MNGQTLPTFRLAAIALGLCGSDTEWETCLREATEIKSAVAVRRLFVIILSECGASDPGSLWNIFADNMSEDFAFRRRGRNGNDINVRDYTNALADIRQRLQDRNKEYMYQLYIS